MTLEIVAQVYETVVTAGVPRLQHQGRRSGQSHRKHPRDLNIALMNELALIFDRLGIDTLDVEAAGTKWNFLPFRPGLVGGHCIGVDPYYLTHKAEKITTSPGNPLPAPPVSRRRGYRPAHHPGDDPRRG
jgi:UDP-N-acetyl-D-galactosamine dehydrogenase